MLYSFNKDYEFNSFNSFSNCLKFIFRYLRMHQDTFMAKYKGRFSAENKKDQDLCAADEEFVGNTLGFALPTKIPSGTRISDFNSEFLGMYLVLILARRKGFLGGHSQEFRQGLNRVNPRRFRHLHGGLGLHQEFHSFSYKQRASQHNSSPQSSREYHSIKLSKFRHPPPQKFSGSILQFLGFSSLQGGGDSVDTIITTIIINVPSSSSPCCSRRWVARYEDSRVCDFKFYSLFHMVYFDYTFKYSL